MTTRIRGYWNYLIRHPRLGVLAALLLIGLLYLGWRGGSALWVKLEREKAVKAIAAYDFDEARRRLERCLRLRSSDPELRLLAARTARRDGDLDAAQHHLSIYRAAFVDPTPQYTLEKQLIVAQQGQVQEVLNELIENIEIHHPQTEQILEALAMGCTQNYQLKQAMFWVHELADRWPKNGIGRLIRARTTDTQGHRDTALSELQELVADYPKYYKARLARADLLYKSQRYREAIEEYGVLNQQRPADILPLLGLASSYDRLGEPAAGPLMKQLVERFPDSSEANLEFGRYTMGQRDPATAEPHLRRAVELAPFDHEAHREFAICLEQLGKNEEARIHLERFRAIEADLILLEKTLAAMAKEPNDPKYRRLAGEICLRNGQSSEGLRWLYGVLEMVPDDKPTHRILAEFWAAQGDTERAGFHARKAADSLPGSVLR